MWKYTNGGKTTWSFGLLKNLFLWMRSVKFLWGLNYTGCLEEWCNSLFWNINIYTILESTYFGNYLTSNERCGHRCEGTPDFFLILLGNTWAEAFVEHCFNTLRDPCPQGTPWEAWAPWQVEQFGVGPKFSICIVPSGFSCTPTVKKHWFKKKLALDNSSAMVEENNPICCWIENKTGMRAR